MRNTDERTVSGFGHQWTTYRQDREEREMWALFERYFSLFPWKRLPPGAVGYDMGCGSGRWAWFVSDRVGRLLCVDASSDAIEVARENLRGKTNVEFLVASVGDEVVPDGSMDFGYSLGVLHHVPDTQGAIDACFRMLKPGAPFLVYLYFAMDNRPAWYRMIWRASDALRKGVCVLPLPLRNAATEVIALIVYWPLARIARLLDSLGKDTSSWPLSDYKDSSYYRMRHNARDRFGTPLEKRFSRAEIEAMLHKAGADQVTFREALPYWCALAYKQS